MQERELQEFLYDHPGVLFPKGKITEKAKEYQIKGKRIDLLFMVDGIRYIVELKARTIEREDIGQIIEYYGLMKEYLDESNLRMILVAPNIPLFRSTFLEELGIRCVVVKGIPKNQRESEKIADKMRTSIKREVESESLSRLIGNQMEGFTRDDFLSEVNPVKVAKTSRLLKDLLPLVEKQYSEFEITPYKITRSNSMDFDLEYNNPSCSGEPNFTHGDMWFAFSFGKTGQEPPNDVPNISVIKNRFVFDVTVNAELQPSQKVLIDGIQTRLDEFDQILSKFDDLMLKTYLKYEHQPRFYHWIPIDSLHRKEFDSRFIVGNYEKHRKAFQEERSRWIEFIISKNKSLAQRQIAHLKRANRSLNFCHRLVFPINFDDPILDEDYYSQLTRFKEDIFRLKEFIIFFLS